ncbi:MAG: GUN4 domain-containing protein [Xenococcus sp. MO_188.B8]|nr:GUN4 domain-containing protein [Xenococcus sp. MO_188.B8]
MNNSPEKSSYAGQKVFIGNESEERWREIFRLLFAQKNNSLRFRKGFSKMLAVQYNSQADRALESELRRLKDELPQRIDCSHLKAYLRYEQWRKADEETAWLFYLVMVQQGYEDWFELCENFPSETLNQIDQLWVDNSKGRFGFSIQKRIWENVGGCSRYADWKTRKQLKNGDWGTGKQFGKQVGWYGKHWMIYNSLPFSTQSPKGNLPALWSTRVCRFHHKVTRTEGGGWQEDMSPRFTWRLGYRGFSGVWGGMYEGERSFVARLFSHQDLT